MRTGRWFLLLLLAVVLSACSSATAPEGGVPAREMVPPPYAGMSHVFGEGEAQKGQETYSLYCQSCHGEKGLGDGPAATALTPPPADLTQLVATVGDDYLFWRISEGKAGTAMISWKGVLSESQIWEIIAFLRTLP